MPLRPALLGLALLFGGAAQAQEPRSCLALDAVTERLNASAGTEIVQEIRGIYVIAGLAFGGERTADRCSQALGELRALEARLRGPGGEREKLRFAATSDWRPGFGGSKVTHWSHNGSAMAYESGPGTARRIWYWQPRAGLRSIGLTRGVLLFDGAVAGGTVSGTARIFKRGCGAYPYSVEGGVTNASRRIVVEGTRPVVADDCSVSGTRPDRLVFDYEGLAPPGTIAAVRPEPEEPSHDAPGFGVWSPVWATHRLPPGEGLNVRRGPGTSHAILGELPNGASGIRVVGEGCTPDPDNLFFESLTNAGKAVVVAKSWCRIEWRHLRGWVYAKYITPI